MMAKRSRYFVASFFLCFFWIFSGFSFAADTKDNASSTEYFGQDASFFQGKEAFQRGETGKARSSLDQYLKDNPRGAHALEARFLLAVAETNLERAKDAFWQIYRDSSDRVMSRKAGFQFGCLVLLEGDYDAACDTFEQLALNSKEPPDQGDKPESVSGVSGSSLAGYGPDGLYALSLIQSGRLPAAKDALDQKNENPESKTSAARWNLLSGMLALKQKRLADAERFLSLAASDKSQPETAAAAMYYKIILSDSSQVGSKKETLIDNLTNAFPNSPEAYVIQQRDKNQ